MRLPTMLVCSLLAACGSGLEDSASGDGASDTNDAGGGGVTFGGAQDLGEFRSILDRGEIPAANTLDANGFFNEHYNPPPPGPCTTTLCLNAGVSVGTSWLTGEYQAALQISVNTNVDPASYARLPMSLVVVVDHSGSMAQDDRLGQVKTGLHTLIENLEPADRLAIISFDDVVTHDAPFTAELDRAHLHDVVEALQPRGSTNLYAGLEAGMQALAEAPNERQNRVIFLSDGLATAGNTSPTAIIEMATGYVSRGIGLTTVGVGVDFDVALMRGLAERGAGNFYFIEDAAAATEVFTDELAYFLAPIALDIEIEAAAAPGWDFANVVGSTLWKASRTRGSMEVPAVFVASRVDQAPGPGGGRRGGGSMIFIALDPTATSAGKIADLRISYRLPDSTERITETLALDYNRDPQEQLAEPYLSYPTMAERFAMYNMYLGLHGAAERAESDHACATAALLATRSAAAAWVSGHEEDQDLAADLALVDQFLANLYAAGAPEGVTLESCASFGDDGGWDDDGSVDGEWDGDDTSGPAFGCSAGGATRSPAAGLVLLGARLGAGRRRRYAGGRAVGGLLPRRAAGDMRGHHPGQSGDPVGSGLRARAAAALQERERGEPRQRRERRVAGARGAAAEHRVVAATAVVAAEVGLARIVAIVALALRTEALRQQLDRVLRVPADVAVDAARPRLVLAAHGVRVLERAIVLVVEIGHRVLREQLVIEPVAVRDLLRHDLAHELRVVGEDIGEREHHRVFDDRTVRRERRDPRDVVREPDVAGVTAEHGLDVLHGLAGVDVRDAHVEPREQVRHAGHRLVPHLVVDLPRRDHRGLADDG